MAAPPLAIVIATCPGPAPVASLHPTLGKSESEAEVRKTRTQQQPRWEYRSGPDSPSVVFRGGMASSAPILQLCLCENQQGNKTSACVGHVRPTTGLKTLVHARRVGQDGSQYRFEHETKVEGPVSHALVENRVTASLTDDQIGPLYDDDRHEERGVAGELEGLAIALLRRPNSFSGRNPFSAMMTKYTKKPAAA
uniref:Uncharacterized protein n=1 Tax=Anopheles coluzzii TaxID=1518534 RepID=A0A8W7PTJ8_ANOCL